MSLSHPINVNAGALQPEDKLPVYRMTLPQPEQYPQVTIYKPPAIEATAPVVAPRELVVDEALPPNPTDYAHYMRRQGEADFAMKEVYRQGREDAALHPPPQPQAVTLTATGAQSLAQAIARVAPSEAIGQQLPPPAPPAPPSSPAAGAPAAPPFQSQEIVDLLRQLVAATTVSEQLPAHASGPTHPAAPGPVYTIYEAFKVDPARLVDSEEGYSEEELNELAYSITLKHPRAISLPLKASKDEYLLQIQQFFADHKDDPQYRQLPVTRRLSGASGSSRVPPPPSVPPLVKPHIYKKFDIDRERLEKSRGGRGGYSVSQLLAIIARINHHQSATKQPPIVAPKGAAKPALYHLIADYIEQHRDDPEYGPVVKGEGLVRSQGAAAALTRKNFKTAHWIPFGDDLLLHEAKLGQGVVSIARVNQKTGGRVKLSNFKNRKVSKEFTDALVSILSQRVLPDLSEMDVDEREYLYSLLALADVRLSLADRQKQKVEAVKKQLKASSAERARASRLKTQGNRLELLLGQVRAGNNNNKEIIREGSKILDSFVKHGVLTRVEAAEVLKKLH